MKKRYIKPVSEMTSVYTDKMILEGSTLNGGALGYEERLGDNSVEDVNPKDRWGIDIVGNQGDEDWNFAKPNTWFEED